MKDHEMGKYKGLSHPEPKPWQKHHEAEGIFNLFSLEVHKYKVRDTLVHIICNPAYIKLNHGEFG